MAKPWNCEDCGLPMREHVWVPQEYLDKRAKEGLLGYCDTSKGGPKLFLVYDWDKMWENDKVEDPCNEDFMKEISS